jgi:MoxR-like ATPase
VVDAVGRTRSHADVELGASPRAGIALLKSAKARALIRGRRYVVPDDLYALAPDVILHRTRLNYEALADGKRGDDVLQEILHDLARGRGREAREAKKYLPQRAQESAEGRMS